MAASEQSLIYDWNALGEASVPLPLPFELRDATLHCLDILPPLAQTVEFLELVSRLGVQSADLAVARDPARAALVMAELKARALPLQPTAVVRTPNEVDIVAELAQQGGRPLHLVIETTPATWEQGQAAVTQALRTQLPLSLALGDVAQTAPDDLGPIIVRAVDWQISRLCLCDTGGLVLPEGVRTLVAWVRGRLAALQASTPVDWLGRDDYGLGVNNALVALESGAQRVHGAGLGLTGHVPIDQLLLNLKLQAAWSADLSQLVRYCEHVAKLGGVAIPCTYPLAGGDAFRTGTGVHAAAIIKAQKKADLHLADRIYSGVPATMFGRHQQIEIGHMSGVSNVIYWLESRRIDYDQDMVRQIYAAAKRASGLLSEAEVRAVVLQCSRTAAVDS